MKTVDRTRLVKAKTKRFGRDVTGWYCEGNVLIGDGRFHRHYILPEYPDLRESPTGVVSCHGFIEINPKTVENL